MNSQETSELAEWHEFNQETIEALIEDGSDASQAHTIEAAKCTVFHSPSYRSPPPAPATGSGDKCPQTRR